MTAEAKTKVNLGCGSRYHPDWINIDMAPQVPEVMQGDLSRGIPLPGASCDVVYHSAVLEHMRRADAAAFLTECYRVLKPGGIMRVGVPDLEKICHLYLSRLTAALNGDKSAEHDYDWIMLELLDQTVREQSGGGMLDFLRQQPIPNESFVYERIGEEGREVVEALQRQPGRSGTRSFRDLLHEVRWRLTTLSTAARRRVPQLALGKNDRRALEIGRFRLAGEVHQWMYDRYSLARLLTQIGFREMHVQDATTSRIPDWASYHLDSMPDGQVMKPDLFFMEVIRPDASS